MTTALVQRTDVPASVPEMMEIARFLAGSKMMPSHLQGDEASTFSVMLAARSLDVPMWAAFQQIIVLDGGKVGMSATLMQALVVRAGHNLYVVDVTDGVATVRAERPRIGLDGSGSALVTFSIDEAVKAELLVRTADGALRARSKSNANIKKPWEKYTDDMLAWRAIGRAARRYFPDVLMGMVHTPDELGADTDEEGNPIHVDSVRMDVDDEVTAYALRITHADTLDALKAVYLELKGTPLADKFTSTGQTLVGMVSTRKAQLVAEDNRRQAAAAAEAPADDSGVSAADVANDTAAEDVAATESEPAEADGFDTLADPAAGDAEELREDTPRRHAVENVLTELLDNWDAVQVAAVEKFGFPADLAGTERLQQWAVELHDAAKGGGKR